MENELLEVLRAIDGGAAYLSRINDVLTEKGVDTENTSIIIDKLVKDGYVSGPKTDRWLLDSYHITYEGRDFLRSYSLPQYQDIAKPPDITKSVSKNLIKKIWSSIINKDFITIMIALLAIVSGFVICYIQAPSQTILFFHKLLHLLG